MAMPTRAKASKVRQAEDSWAQQRMNIHHKESWEPTPDENMSVGRQPIARSSGVSAAQSSKKILPAKLKDKGKNAVNSSKDVMADCAGEQIRLPAHGPARYGLSRKLKKKLNGREDSLLGSSIYCGGSTAMSNL